MKKTVTLYRGGVYPAIVPAWRASDLLALGTYTTTQLREPPPPLACCVAASATRESRERHLREDHQLPERDGVPAPILEHYQKLPIIGIRRAETELRQLFASATDRESEHGERDRILLELLDVLAPEIATLVREREDKVGYWYA